MSMDENKNSKILIFGKNGQVGYELCRTLSTLGEIYAVDIDECDLTDKVSIINTLDGFKPTVIANAAAYTAVDKAERERELAFKLNADAPGIMADWAAKHDSLMIHYSTDYVFDGTKKSRGRKRTSPTRSTSTENPSWPATSTFKAPAAIVSYPHQLGLRCARQKLLPDYEKAASGER